MSNKQDRDISPGRGRGCRFAGILQIQTSPRQWHPARKKLRWKTMNMLELACLLEGTSTLYRH